MTLDVYPPDNANMNVGNYGGAMALLRDCVGGQTGERLLIVSETEQTGYYDENAAKQTAAAGRALGMVVYEMQWQSFFKDDVEKTALLSSIAGFDHVVFFSRVGDQIRFSNNLNIPSSTMCYTLDHRALESNFGTACYHGMQEIKLALDSAFATATEIKVTCPRGTEFSGCPDWDFHEAVDVCLKRFPLSVPTPVTAKGFTGRIALCRFLVGTGSRHYEPYYLPLPNDVFAIVEHGRITKFEGAAKDVMRVEKHYDHVSTLFSIDPWCVDSWHAGIHPGCQFDDHAETNMLRWSGTAFGNPRLLHFHTCGEYAPGEISWNILDPTVVINGIAVWEAGKLHPERVPGGQEILLRHPDLAKLFENPSTQIGLSA